MDDDRTLPLSLSTPGRAKLCERLAGAGGLLGGVPGGYNEILLLLEVLLDSRESRARDKEVVEDVVVVGVVGLVVILLIESRLVLLLRDKERLRDSLLASFPDVLLVVMLCLLRDSRLESLAVPRDNEDFVVPALLSRLESLGGLEVSDFNDFNDSRLSFLFIFDGGFGATGFVPDPSNGMRLGGRLRGDGFISAE